MSYIARIRPDEIRSPSQGCIRTIINIIFLIHMINGLEQIYLVSSSLAASTFS